jgi:hypothetical protein
VHNAVPTLPFPIMPIFISVTPISSALSLFFRRCDCYMPTTSASIGNKGVSKLKKNEVFYLVMIRK